MQYTEFIFSILLAGVAECIGKVASEDGSSNAARSNVGAATLVRPSRQAVNAVGGSPASTADYPFVAFVTWYWTRTRNQTQIRPRNLSVTTLTAIQCTGTLVAPKFVMTSATCFLQRIGELTKTPNEVLEWRPNEAWVRCGADDGWKGGPPQAQTSAVVKIIIHQKYVQLGVINTMNVALLELQDDMVREDHAKPALFSGGFAGSDRMNCHAVGFGKINVTNRSTSRPLHSHPVVLGGSSYCHDLQETFTYPTYLYGAYMLCGLPDSITECFAEVGSPVVCADMVTGMLTRRMQKVPCGGGQDFSVYISAGYSRVVDMIKHYAGEDVTPTVNQLPSEDLLVPLVREQEDLDDEGTSSSTVLGSKGVAVVLLAFIGFWAV